MRSRIAVLVVFCLACAAAVPLLAQANKSDDSATITRLENEGAKAALANDASWTKKYTTDDYVGGTSFGEWESRASQLKDFADPKNNKTNSYAMKDLKVQTYGNAAVARYTVTYDDLYHGQHRSRTVICTDMWVKQGAEWKKAADHCSQTK